MSEVKPKLIELNYSYEALPDLNAVLNLRRISNELMKRLTGIFEIYVYGFGKFEVSEDREGIHYRFKNKKYGKLGIPGDLHREIKRLNPSFVLVHGLVNYFRVIHLKITLGKKCKVLVQHHGEQIEGFFKKCFFRFSARYVDVFLFTDEEAAKKLGLSERKIRLVMEGSTTMQKMDAGLSRKRLGLPADKTVYLWVGRLIQRKNPIYFLKHFLEFQQRQPEVFLYLIYHDEELLTQCRSLCAGNERIIFVGKQNAEDMNHWFSAADYFVSASVWEGSGYALCEAMACGCIPIVPSIGPFKFMTKRGDCALMYDLKNPNSLLQVLKTSTSISKEALQEKVKTQFKTYLSFEAIAAELQNITQGLSESNK